MHYYETLLTVYLCISGLCCIIATRQAPKFEHTPLILAPVILWLGFVTEVTGTILNFYISSHNGWIFNVYTFIYFALLYLLIYRYLDKSYFKKMVTLLGGAALLFHGYRLLTADSFNDNRIYSMAFLVFVFLLSSAFYMMELLQRETVFTFKKHPEVFFIGGYLIFYLVYAPLNVAYDLNLRIFSLDFYIILKSIQGYVLIAVNLLFIYVFLWMKKAHL